MRRHQHPLQQSKSPGMSRREVNIATISEEDVLGEEIGADGMVEMVPSNRISGERFDESDTESPVLRKKEIVTPGSARNSSERRSSLIERDDNEVAEVSNSILKAISSLEGPSKSASTALSRSKSTESLTSSSYTRTQPTVPTASTMKRTASWRGSRAPGSTMNLLGKFVTELTLYDPFSGPMKCSCVNLGMFLATDQTMGDHFVYKMSPVSPLSSLKIQQQDRLLRVNDISVVGWSHNCVVEFIRNLTLSSDGNCNEMSKEKIFEMPFSMEFRKAGKAIRSAEESPSSKRVAATVKIRNQRASVSLVHDSLVRVRHSSSSTARLKLRDDLQDGLSLYIKTSATANNVIDLHVGHHSSPDDAVYFRLHYFDESPARSEQGDLAVIEGPSGGGYLLATSPTSVAFMHGLTTPPSTLFQIDVRFFLITRVPGSSTVRLRNIQTGRYLSASKEMITLVAVNEDMTLPASTQFELFKSNC